jgi:hypothetical protein
LILKSSNGLGNNNSETNDLELVQTLNKCIENKKSHLVIEDILERLSKAHGTSKTRIVIKHVYFGSSNVVYTVLDLTDAEVTALQGLSNKLREQFQEFANARIPPLLYRPSFDISDFDARGDKPFGSQPQTFQIGRPGRTKLYTTAAGWTCYGLNVLGKRPPDNWLHPFQDPGNWYRAFHETGHARNMDFWNSKPFSDPAYACVDAFPNILRNGFNRARTALHGAGVYCSPNPKYPEENGHVGTVTLETRQGRKSFKCMLQVAVDPDSVQCSINDVWFAPPEAIRAYGILIKEATH